MEGFDAFAPGVVEAGVGKVTLILKSWGCSNEQVSKLLLLESSVGGLDYCSFTYDQVLRISYVLKIDEALRFVFSNPKNIDGFMTMKNENKPFSGARPLDVLLSGTVEDFDVVLRYMERLTWGVW